MKLISRKVVDGISKAEYQRHFKDVQQPIVGALESARLLDQRQLVFQQRRYRVPPVPYRLAVQIIDVRGRIRDLQQKKAPASDVLEVLEQAAVLSKAACRPRTLVQKALWALPFYNPFRRATPFEVGVNFAFFSQCLGRDLQPELWEPVSRALGTSSSTQAPSRSVSPSGAIPRGGRGKRTAASH